MRSVNYDLHSQHVERRQRPARDLRGVGHGEAEEAEHALGVVDVGVGGRVAVENRPHDAEQRAAGAVERDPFVGDREATGTPRRA